MIGTGKANVSTLVSVAQAQAQDGELPEAVKAFASLGCWGKHRSNEERDMHRWLHNLYDRHLEVYHVDMELLAGALCIFNDPEC